MISDSMRVKALIRNLAKGDSGKAQLLQRRYAMECFLERVAKSRYRQNLVLKGGMLVAAMLDVGARMTRDTDVTMQGLSLTVDSAVAMVRDIVSIPLEDGVSFDIEDAYEIMEDFEYRGVCIEMRARLGKTEIPVKLDISTGDALTPSAIRYAYRLMLEDRDIEILAYNTETVLAEKLETMLSRSTFNTRMRDFYDMWALSNMGAKIDYGTLADAIEATSRARGHDFALGDSRALCDALASSKAMADHWERYRERYDFAAGLSWEDALDAARALCNNASEARGVD